MKYQAQKNLYYALVVLLLIAGLSTLHPSVLSSYRPLSPFGTPSHSHLSAVDRVQPGCISTEGLETEVLGDIPGFIVFRNIWFHKETFYTYSSTKRIPLNQDQVVSHPTRLVHSHKPLPRPSTCFRGSSIWINENGKKGWHGLYHYFHFAAENVLSGFAALSRAKPPQDGVKGTDNVVERLLIPWEGGWRDKWGLNKVVVNGIWGSEGGVIDKDAFKGYQKSRNGWMFFETVVILVRWASHRYNPSTALWYKMSYPILILPPPLGFFDGDRSTLLNSINTTANLTDHDAKSQVHIKGDLPRVVYVDRQSSTRKLKDENHIALQDLFYGLDRNGKVDYWHLILEDYTPEEQIGIIAEADVLVGVHGNGLTHEIWMKEGSTVIELFPPESFLADYATLSIALGHAYYAVQNDHVLYRHQWQEVEPGQRQSEAVYDGTEIQVDVNFLSQLVDDILAVEHYHKSGMTVFGDDDDEAVS